MESGREQEYERTACHFAQGMFDIMSLEDVFLVLMDVFLTESIFHEDIAS